MRLAVVSDIHANLTALEAVVADLNKVGVDMVVHGGDLVAGGTRPAEVIDMVRDLKWPGVAGNTDEMLWMPERISQVLGAPAFKHMRDGLLDQIIPETCQAIGAERLAWLRALPRRWSSGDTTVVHASPDDLWLSPGPTASDDELERTYGPLGSLLVVYGHIHHPFVRKLPAFTVANSGSVSFSYDGDRRASYLLIDHEAIVIRRVEYDVEDEITRLIESRYPDAEWLAQIFRTATPIPPPVG
jgi:predicted phosphodiesterase